MKPLQRYIAEEIAVDHADGLLTRREAVRRLGLLGLGTAAAASLLAACGPSPSPKSSAPTPSGTASPPGLAGAVSTIPITFPALYPHEHALMGAFAAAAQPIGAVLVVHENKGLTDHIRSVTGRFAGAGYSALAVDLLSGDGGTAAFSDPATATAELGIIPQQQLVSMLEAGVAELQRRVPGKKVGATGFCFGGGLVWLMLTTGATNLAAATPFYGPFPAGGVISGSPAVLAVYASEDTRVDATRPAAEAALNRAAAPHEIFVARGANHAFFNDTGPRYDAGAADEAWHRVVDWYGRYLS